MKFSVAFDSIGKFKLDTSCLIDGCDYFKLVINGGRQKDEITFIDPFTPILCTYLKQTLSVTRLKRENAQ